ncbi:MAG TPA: sugar phosphate isomerase/epimerase family protein [Bryobacteraceae bacterium]|nr:sugar phosphate isomerase/epimerase family protein [Bryobacteraceae bacterium]
MPDADVSSKPLPMGINSYSLRALRWDDRRLLEYAAEQKMDGLFLQDSLDPKVMDPAHWDFVRARAKELGLHLETGGGGIFPKSADAFRASVATLEQQIARARAMGSPVVRAVIASERAALPPGPIEQHLETMARLLKAVRSRVVDAGLKIAIEVHKDLQAWELRQLIEAAGRDFVGVYMDTGNPVFVLEHPLTTLEALAPYVVTFHLRDSAIYEHKRGVAVQWVPLGEGVVDFREIMARARELCPNVYYYIKPITGRPPQVLPYLDPGFWKLYPNARASDLARFLALARSGQPYERPVVLEDLPGRQAPPHLLPAIQAQQREHMERSVRYAREVLNLGMRWRT